MRRSAALVVLVGCAEPAPPVAPMDEHVIVRDACAPAELATGDREVFWIARCDGGSIRSVALGGGAISVLATGEAEAAMLASDGEYVYWMRVPSVGYGGSIVRMPRDGGAIAVLATGQSEMFTTLPQQLAVDATQVYRSRFSKDGSSPQATIAIGDSAPFLAVDGSGLYWANGHSVHHRPAGTSLDETLAETGRIIGQPIALTRSAVWFWNGGLAHAPKDGGPGSQIVLEETPLLGAFAGSADVVIWQRSGELMQADEAGEVSTLLTLTNLTAPVERLAADDERVYWIANGSVMSVPL